MRLVLSVLAGVGCAGSLPAPPDDDDSPETTADTATPTTDTGPAGPCRVVEAEPNNSPDEATPLIVEQRACGRLDGEPDVYAFTLDDDGWVEFEVAAADGSIADVSMRLSNPEFVVVSDKAYDTDDVRLAFQAPAGDYTLAVNEEDGNGGERYAYEVLVSEIKAPVSWTTVEVEGNDDFATAQPLGDGDAVFGVMERDVLPDEDWYRVDVQSGRHDVRFDVNGREEGSGANLTGFLYDEDLELIQTVRGGPGPAPAPDPDVTYASSGGEVLFFKLEQAQTEGEPLADEGRHRWYVLDVTVEAQ